MIHRGADVRVPHHFLLHTYRSSDGIEPSPVCIAERMRAEMSDASGFAGIGQILPDPGVAHRLTALLPG